MSWEPGEARGHKLVRNPEIIKAGDRIVAELGEQVARLHRIEPPVSGLDFISVPTFNPALARIEELQRYLGEQAEPQPVLEMALRWLGTNLPETDRVCLVHGDLRTGNFLVHEGRLSAILDFEFAAFSDPLEDLGWMLARCWRFGQYDKVAGGIGSAEAFLDAYERTTDRSLDRRALPYWQVMATVRWAVIALEQAARAYVQKENSLELALTGEVVPSLEWDILDFIDRIERRDIGPGWLR
jgi:aminoglycoside phosphotransferase (APT) family kinase protein